MNILFILEYYHPHTGGVETFFKNLVERLDHQGHRVEVITNKHDLSLPSVEQYGNVTIRRYRFWSRYVFTFGAWWVAMKPAQRADIIHTTSYNAALPSWIVAKIKRRPSIITFHEVWNQLWFELPWMTGWIRHLHRAFEKMLCRLSFDRFVAVSDYTRQSLLDIGVSQRRVMRIYNGIEYPMPVRHKTRQGQDTFRFLFFGRVSYSKGVDLLLEASSLLKMKGYDFILELVVPSERTPLLDKAMDMIARYDLESRIYVQHDLPQDQLQHKIAHVDAVVIPSYSEGFCFAAVETMAIGTPIISSGRGALKEVVGGKYLEMQEFNASELAEQMILAMKHQWLSKEIRTFELSDTIGQYEDLYKKLLTTPDQP